MLFFSLYPTRNKVYLILSYPYLSPLYLFHLPSIYTTTHPRNTNININTITNTNTTPNAYTHIGGFVQDCSNSIATALELLQSCTKPSMYSLPHICIPVFHVSSIHLYLSIFLFSFSSGFHVSGQIWPWWRSPDVLIIIYVSGTYDYLYIHESYLNLIWYLYLFLLNKLCLSLSLSRPFLSSLTSSPSTSWGPVWVRRPTRRHKGTDGMSTSQLLSGSVC